MPVLTGPTPYLTEGDDPASPRQHKLPENRVALVYPCPSFTEHWRYRRFQGRFQDPREPSAEPNTVPRNMGTGTHGIKGAA